jgi:3D-(3,5/4)-trihydroxycyclohexane-1,2-dione acylhydrolase (decyclizing)
MAKFPGARCLCANSLPARARHPYRAGPFNLLLPLNTQPARLTVNLAGLPTRPVLPVLAPASGGEIAQAAAVRAASTPR